jgi:hypothetical protein
MRVLVLAAAGLAAGACAAHASPPSDLSWMSGYWLRCEGSEQVSETWSDVRAGTLLGTSFTLSNGRVSWEQARIAKSDAGVLTFFVQPSGQPAAEFPLNAEKSSERRLVFENLAHDFPQRVIYARDGDRLTGRIEGVMEGREQAMDWAYQPAALNAGCPR